MIIFCPGVTMVSSILIQSCFVLLLGPILKLLKKCINVKKAKYVYSKEQFWYYLLYTKKFNMFVCLYFSRILQYNWYSEYYTETVEIHSEVLKETYNKIHNLQEHIDSMNQGKNSTFFRFGLVQTIFCYNEINSNHRLYWFIK